VAEGLNTDLNEDFWGWDKMSGIALKMVLIPARRLELKSGLFNT